MAWIESHTVLIRHRKLIEMARTLRLKPVYLLGHFHALWHSALEQQEDGDLSSWSDEFIAGMSCFEGDFAKYVSLLDQFGWLDGRLLHDWLDYAGLYLTKKYSTSNKALLIDIWKKHGRVYGSQDQPLVNKQRTNSERLVNLPNQPNLPNQQTTTTPQLASEFKPPPASKTSSSVVPYEHVFESWNKTLPHAKIRVLTEKRKKRLRGLWAVEHFKINYEDILKKICHSKFLCGDNDRRWVADFDWLIANDNNYAKILEGKYDEREEQSRSKSLVL